MDGLLMGFITVRPKLELQQSSKPKGVVIIWFARSLGRIRACTGNVHYPRYRDFNGSFCRYENAEFEGGGEKKAWLVSGRIRDMAHLEQLLGSCLVGGSHL